MFDVFLSHNSKDKSAVRDLKQQLAAHGLTVWYDEDELRPGIPWQQLLEAGIRSSASIAVLVGKDGLGPWEDEEMQGALRLAVKDKRPVIPVLLPGAARPPELPMFLGNRTWVDLCTGFTDEGIENFVWGITGKKPSHRPGRPRVYISYSWHSRDNEQHIRELAESLREGGIDCRIDQYYAKSLHGFTPPNPPPGRDAWTAWQEEQIRDADRVLIVCSPEYAAAPDGSGVGRDLEFMRQDLLRPGVGLEKYIPVGFGPYAVNRQFMPSFIQGANYYDLTPGGRIAGLEDLIRCFRSEFPGATEAREPEARTVQPPAAPERTPIMQAPIDFVIITPLEEEREAMLLHLGMPKRLPPTADDIRVYYPATIPVTFTDGTTGEYKVVLTDLLGMGRVEAANAVGDAVRRWRPKYVLLVGIAGGLAKAGVKLGDVLISEQIADYELQKLTPEKADIRWSVHRAAPRLLAAAKQLRPEDWRPLIREARPEPGQSQRHAGPICTGDKVIANRLMDQYADVWVKLIGVEMEAGGAASGAFQAPDAPGFFMVRGVSDLADAEKDKAQTQSWRAYACDVAAAYVAAFLKSGPVPANP